MNWRKYLFLGTLLLFGLLAVACGATATPEPARAVQTVTTSGEVVVESKALVEAGAPAQPGGITERKVIRTAEIAIIVDDVAAVLPKVEGMVNGMGGHIVSSNSYRTATDRLAATITLRVPENRFDEAMSQLRALPGKVQSEKISGEDVTDQYVDLQARLTALQATEKELLALLTEVRESGGNAQQKAEAILDIYSRLTDVRSQIEQIQGQMNYLAQMSAMATITVQLTPREPEIEQPVAEEGFDPLRTVNRAARALLGVLEGAFNVLLWALIVLLPIAAILGLPVLLVVWFIRRRRQRVKAQSEK